jgi:hypothetical protein
LKQTPAAVEADTAAAAMEEVVMEAADTVVADISAAGMVAADTAHA